MCRQSRKSTIVATDHTTRVTQNKNLMYKENEQKVLQGTAHYVVLSSRGP